MHTIWREVFNEDVAQQEKQNRYINYLSKKVMLGFELISTTQFWLALGSIILIDIVLAGDNAIVIAMAAARLPLELQRRAILLGTAGAILMRSLLTLVAVYLLQIPGLMIIGGCLLLWIAYNLLVDNNECEHKVVATTLRQALKTILVADTVMSMDNVLAVAGASDNNLLLVVLGLLISIPLVVWGSTFVLKMLRSYPILIYLGAAVLVITAVNMLLQDILVKRFVSLPSIQSWLISLAATCLILLAGYYNKRHIKASHKNTE